MELPQTVRAVVDKHLANIEKQGLNALPLEIEPAMRNEPVGTGWQSWHPIASQATAADIQGLEKELGIALPPAYAAFLQYRHFYDLQVGEIGFFRHPVNTWRAALLEAMRGSELKQGLVAKGYFPFANYGDWGLACFDATKPAPDNEYPIVIWDRERAKVMELLATSFTQMLTQAAKEATQATD